MPYIRRYFGWFAHELQAAGYTLGALYVATFLPAFTSHGNEPDFVLCGAPPHALAWAYEANRTFDTAGKGYITVGDLTAAAERAFAGNATGQAIVAALDRLYPEVADTDPPDATS